MKISIRKIVSGFLIIASVAAVFLIAFSNEDLENAWAAFGSMDFRWLLGVFACWVIYTVFDGMNYWAYLHREGFRIRLGRAVNVALIGFYYSNITPSAAGGQPMQVSSMRKAGIPVGYGTMAVTVRFVCNQFMTCMISLVLFLVNRSFVMARLGDAIWIVRVGWLINFISVPIVLLAVFRRNRIQKLFNRIILWLHRIHILKNPELSISRVTETLDTYHSALRDLIRRPAQILLQLTISTVSMMGLFLTVVFVYHAFGLSGTEWDKLLTISSLLFVSASYTPLPGASGAQEGGFLLYFKGIFTDGFIGLALLVWRFFSFYLFLIVGIFTVILEKILLHREAKQKIQMKKD